MKGTFKDFVKNKWNIIKLRPWFWTGLILFILFDLMVGCTIYKGISYSAEASASFSAVDGPFLTTDVNGNPYNHTVYLSAILHVQTEDGPFVAGRAIYGDYIEFNNLPDADSVPEYEIEHILLNFTLYSTEIRDIDTEQVISIKLEDIDNINDEVELSQKNGYVKAERSGLKQLRMELIIKFKNWSRYTVGEYSTNGFYNQLEIDSHDSYQNYLYTKIAVVGIAISAFTYSFPATYKTVNEIYRAIENKKEEH